MGRAHAWGTAGHCGRVQALEEVEIVSYYGYFRHGTELDGNITAIETAPAIGTEKAGRSEMQPFPANARGRRCEPE